MPQLNGDGEVRAAGGVVTRDAAGTLEVLLVHRPKYDDWTLPKGKAEKGETDEACALREVREETGFECELLDELPQIRYRDRLGRAKVVRYWRMRPVGGRFEPHDEVDRLAWVPTGEATAVLTYERDAEVIDALSRTGR